MMTTQAVNSSVKPGRRYDIDWLRVLAVLLLFPYHTARIFDTFDNFYVKNDQLSQALTYFIAYVNPWHMPLLFLLAGAATYFALRFRSGGQYALERFKRLLVPLIFGVLVLVPPQSYLGLRNHSNYSGSFLGWYPSFFQGNAADLDGYFLGGFTLAHLWFILYLFVFALVALPLFLFLRSATGQKVVGWLAVFCSWPGTILLLAIPIFLASRLIDFHPNPLLYLLFFVYGYLLFADPRFGEAIDRHKALALVLGPVLFLVAAYFNMTSWPENPLSWFIPIVIFYVEGLARWLFIIAILGYGRRFLSFSNGFLRYTGLASYPYYILHQTVIVIIGFFVVQWAASVAVKYVLILVAAIVVTAALYELLMRRFNVTRFLFGMRPKKKPAKEPRPRLA
jgi:peptidoglycan/LPS O-acetylase OafA/YrhL